MKIFTFLALACFYGTSEAKETITWVTENFEPFFIQEGPMKGAGITDRLTAALIKELPEYEHVTEYMPILRITNSLQNGDHIAVNSYLKSPKDESFAIYSITSTVVPPLEMTIREQDWLEKWKGAKKISLTEFMKQGFLVGYAGRRYYGDKLTPILLNKKDFPKSTYVVQSTHYRSLADMVAHHRIDATIGYAAELKYYENFSAKAEKLISVPITENPDFLYAYVVLPKTTWGKAVKQKLDTVLLKVRKTDAYKDIFYDWFAKTASFEQAIRTQFSSKE